MSRDMGLIGLLRYLPLAQFTKARPVDSLGPFSLASLKTGFVMATRLPATRGCTAHTNDRRINVLESLRDSSSPPGTRGLLTRGCPHDSCSWAYPVYPKTEGPQGRRLDPAMAQWRHPRMSPRLIRKVQTYRGVQA